ncbi:MAG: hypothetical protein AAGA93_04395 [Actinomycetota bacterium]
MAEDIPARFRKTKTDKWAVMAPVEALEKALAEGGKIDVQRKSGDWSTFTVASLGRPFDVDGVQMCYGYGPEDDQGDGSASTAGAASGAGSGGGGRAATADNGGGRPPARPPRRPVADAPPADPSEPMPEYQGGPDDEWDGF